MKTLDMIYEDIYNENIYTTTFTSSAERKAVIVNQNESYCIGLDYSKVTSSAEEKCLIAEEFCHYSTNTLYPCNSKLNLISKNERRARKRTIRYLIPKSELDYYINIRNIKTTYELSEIFGVTEELMFDAFELYYKIESQKS